MIHLCCRSTTRPHRDQRYHKVPCQFSAILFTLFVSFNSFNSMAFLDPDFIQSLIVSLDSPEAFSDSLLKKRLPLHGKLDRVLDGDTIRWTHQPFLKKFFNASSSPNKDSSSVSIRLAGIDCPETPKQGSSGQPFGLEAKNHVQSLMQGKTVKIVPVSKDQYGRILAMVFVKSNPFDAGLNVSVDLISRGFATVYKGQGSDYDGMKGTFIETEKRAKESKVGIWSLDHYESPGQYKRRQKEGAPNASGSWSDNRR